MIRILVILLTVLLYIIPFYRHLQDERYWNSRHPVELPAAAVSQAERPYYAEDFVNEEKAGTICHVSSICPLDSHRMACTWYAGSKESGRDVAIYLSVFDESKAEWSAPSVFVDRETCSGELRRYARKVGNALIYRDGKGRIWLFYSSVIIGGWSGSSLNYKVSSDGGRTWSRSEKLLLSPFFNLTENVKNKGVNLDDGSIVIPVYHELFKKYSELLFIRTADDGTVRYEVRKITRQGSAMQPSLLRGEGRTLVAFFRNMSADSEKHILAAHSDDLGMTWSEPVETSLPNPDSGFDMIRMSDGGLLGVINNSFRDRGNLSLVLSRDGARTWKTIKVLENREGREYSYPSINRSGSGLYHVTYTYEKRRIKHVAFNEPWVREMEEQAH